MNARRRWTWSKCVECDFARVWACARGLPTFDWAIDPLVPESLSAFGGDPEDYKITTRRYPTHPCQST